MSSDDRWHASLKCAIQEKEALSQRSILGWASKHSREYPWRQPGRTPYEVMVAELLLKRTTATSAAKTYDTFLGKYPTLIHLATASEKELARDLASVGLHHQRANAISKLGRYLVEEEHGNVPGSLGRLLKVPGLGAYSARAVLSFGYGIPVAVVDANVRRVLHKVFQETMPPKPTQSLLQEVTDALLPEHAHRQFNFGLLDLGALVCRYVRPDCESCPLNTLCDFCKSGGVADLPSSRLREIRLAKGVGLAELAKRARVSKLTIINIEAGRTTPQPRTVEKLAEALGVTPQDLTS